MANINSSGKKNPPKDVNAYLKLVPSETVAALAIASENDSGGCTGCGGDHQLGSGCLSRDKNPCNVLRASDSGAG